MRLIKSVGVLSLLLFLALFPLASALAAEEDLASISKGLEDFKAGHHEDARKVFEAIVQADPSNADAYYYLGLSLSKLERYSPAATAFENALELNPQLTDVYLSLGIAYYKIKSMDQAEQALKQGVEADPQNSASQFFLGLVYQNKDQDQKSIQYFSKAGELDPDFRQLAFYNVGQAYFNMGRNEDARGAFQQAIDVDPQSDMGEESLKFLTIVDRQERAARRWKVQTSAAWEFDDNVTRVEQDVISNVGDFSVNLGFQGEYKIVNNPKYEVSLGYDVFQSIFQDLTEFNFQSHGISFSGAHDADSWDAGLDYSYTYNLLGNRQFLGIHSISPSFGFSLRPNLYTSFSYTFQDKTFFRIQARDANNQALGVTQFYFFMKSKAYLNFSYRVDFEDTSGPQFDYTGHTLNGVLQLPLPFETKVRLSYRFRLKDYQNVTPSIGVERKDDKETIRLVLTKKLMKYMNFTLDYRRIEASSNLPAVDFRENIILVGFIFPL